MYIYPDEPSPINLSVIIYFLFIEDCVFSDEFSIYFRRFFFTGIYFNYKLNYRNLRI